MKLPRLLPLHKMVVHPEVPVDHGFLPFAVFPDEVAGFAAHACVQQLAESWAEDAGADRDFILRTLDATIERLTAWRTVFAAVVVAGETRGRAAELVEAGGSVFDVSALVTAAVELEAPVRPTESLALAREAICREGSP